MTLRHLALTPAISLSFLGPDLTAGPLPAIFYFALSADESLSLDPINQPATFLTRHPVRIFSLSLPAHGNGDMATEAFSVWASQFASGVDPLTPFIEKGVTAIEMLFQRNLISHLGIMGLSRGGLIGAHIAARIPQAGMLLAFAPVTDLAFSKEFRPLAHLPLIQHLKMDRLAESLAEKRIRFYIGNRDERVGTGLCFHTIQLLTETAYAKKIRSPQVELIVSPSIGHLGHGTPREVFEDGAAWMARHVV
jgi:hypothetical protein